MSSAFLIDLTDTLIVEFNVAKQRAVHDKRRSQKLRINLDRTGVLQTAASAPLQPPSQYGRLGRESSLQSRTP